MAGRPTKYNKELQAKADEYVDGGFWKEEVVPTQEGLSLYIEVALSTVKAWASDGSHPEFSATLERCKSKQAQMLATGALKGDLNATIAKLMLANHGYSERLQQDNISSDGSMTPKEMPTKIEIVAKEAK